jgi:regulator of cell morphogenesis and NO signaling
MSGLNEQNTVAEWVLAEPGHTRLFERMGIDFCCGGQKTLAQACAEKGLDARTVIQTMEAMAGLGGPATDRTDWNKASLTALADHIQNTHHQYVKDESGRLEMLLRKIAQVHGPNHPELREVLKVYTHLMNELMSHMTKEESILFPAIRELEANAGRPVAFPFGSVGNPIRMMIAEHDSAGEDLSVLSRLTNGYAVPADGCNTYRLAMEGLKEYEEDLHQHIHKENNILFPRAVAMEAGQR